MVVYRAEMYFFCHRRDWEIISRVIYIYDYCTQDSEQHKERKSEGISQCYLDRDKSESLKLSHSKKRIEQYWMDRIF